MNPKRWIAPFTPAIAVALGFVGATSALGQTAPTNPDGTNPNADEIVQLSPFQVDVSRDRGYAAENTLAGSRIKTPLQDIAASITVVTKQQMEDTASLDINDVFRYEASTEGSTNYTPLILDRGTAKDAVAGYSFGNNGDASTNATANRVRGLSSPDAAINNYSTNARIPFDAYNTQSLEISRGPNSLLFGLGSPAGIVNTNFAQAMVNRDSNNVTVRTDHNGQKRGTIAINRVLVKDKLAFYAAAMYDDRQFERKPSRDLYTRQYGALTFRPFKNTVIRAFAENYRNEANRPNSITPRDQVTPWITSGRPVYDPVSRNVTVLDTGRVVGPFVSSTKSPGYVAPVFNPTTLTATGNVLVGTGALTTLTVTNGGRVYPNPMFVPGIVFDDVGRPLRRIEDGQSVDLFARQYGFYRPAHTNPETALPNTNTWAAGDPRFLYLDRMWTASGNLPQPEPVIGGVTHRYSTWNWAGVTDKNIYDWTKYNTLQSNFAKVRAAHYNLEVEQQITDDLFVSAGWFRQDIDQRDNYTVNQLQGATLGIDTNQRMVDGTPNPYFGLPFIYEGAGGGLDTFYSPQTDDNYRVLATYRLDFTKNANWSRWLGKHNLVATWQDQESRRQIERWRMNFFSTDPDIRLRYERNLTLTNQALWSTTATMRHYYMASPGDPMGQVTQSAGFYGNRGWDGTVDSNIQVFDLATQQYVTKPISERAVFADAGSFKTQREVTGGQVALQSYLWQDRLVTTFGVRKDKYRARVTTTGIIRDAAGAQVEPALTAAQLYTANSTGEINRDLVLNRWNRWDELEGTTKTLGLTFRPLKNWDFTKALGEGSLAHELVDSLTLYYNQSDNFNPPSTFQTDYFGVSLPKPTGEGRDIGVGFSLFKNKLVARVNWYETELQNERTAAAGTLLTRLIYPDTTFGMAWASTVLRIRKAVAAGRSLDPASPNSIFVDRDWNSDARWNVSSEADQRAIYDLIKLPYQYYSGVSVGGTQNSKAKGVELQLTYNPTPNLRLKVTGSKDQSTYTNVAPQYDAWYAQRMPVWTSLAATDIPDFVDPNNGRRFSLRNFWESYGYQSAVLAENTDGNTNVSNYFTNTVVSQVALAKALEGARAPSQRQYNASLLANYTFPADRFGGKLRGWGVGGSQRYGSKAIIGYHGKVGDPTQPTVINLADITRPVYDEAQHYTDLWLSYSRKIWNNKVNMRIQLNCNNAFEGGRLQPIAVNFDGKPWAFRIIDPRQWILQATFNF